MHGFQSDSEFLGYFSGRSLCRECPNSAWFLLVVSHEALHFDMPGSAAAARKSSGQLDHACERACLIAQLVDRRAAQTMPSNGDCAGRSRGTRTVLSRFRGAPDLYFTHDGAWRGRGYVHGFDELRCRGNGSEFASSPRSVGPPAANSALRQGGKRADVVRAGARNVAYFINADGAKPGKRNIGRLVPKLGSQNLLEIFLHLREAFSADRNRPHFRQADAAFAVDHAVEPLRDSAPQVDGETVSRSHDVVGSGRKIHRNQLRVARAVFKNFRSKPAGRNRSRDRLHVHVIKRWNIFIRAARANHFRRFGRSGQRGPAIERVHGEERLRARI